MADEILQLETENGRSIEAVVVSKSAEAIWVAIGSGVHNVRCKLEPTRNAQAYAGSVMGREVLYRRSVKEVRADLAREQQVMDRLRRR